MRMNISVPDTLAEQVRERNIAISAICQRALSEEVARLEALENAIKGMKQITVVVGMPGVTVGFTGRWLVEPDRDDTRTREPNWSPDAYWGIALTERGRIAVLTAWRNDISPATLNDFDSLDQAGAPADIIARAAAELANPQILWRDI